MASLPVSIRGATGREEGGTFVIRVSDPHALTQVIGWLKFANRGDPILYRGSTDRHPDMLASGFRSVGRQGRRNLAHSLRQFISALVTTDCRCKPEPYSYGQAHLCRERVRRSTSSPLASGTYCAAVEPLLQHYGIRTRWLDVVDNIWIALWFACHNQVTIGDQAYHQRRSVAQEGMESLAHIAVLRAGEQKPTDIPGYTLGQSARVVDLRYAVPSTYLRPHAQHGLLIAPATLPDKSSGSLVDNVVANLEIALDDALAWLGTGVMLSTHVLFPPAVVDEGFRKLLKLNVDVPANLGRILYYGPGI
jgi:hypothetical protein